MEKKPKRSFPEKGFFKGFSPAKREFPRSKRTRLSGNSLIGSPLSMRTMKNLFLEEEFEGKNLAYSPLSIYAALGLLTFGAQGGTLNQLLEFLKAPNLDSLNQFCSQFMNLLNQTRTCNYQGFELSCVNSVWVEKSRVLNPKFKEVADSIFEAEAGAVDFKFKAEEVRQMVNQWVETKTSGLIKDLIPPGFVDSSTAIVLVNALYFKGLWRQGQFDKSQTKDRAFYLLDGNSSVQVPFMTSTKRKQQISCHDGFKVLQLPYKLQAKTTSASRLESSPRFSMYILLPDKRDGLGELIEMASTDSASFFNQYLLEDLPFEPTRDFKIPKFKVTFDFEAKEVLKKMGLVLPFGSEAELTGMVDKNVCVTSVVHKCFVEVDEEGTEAAAATSMGGCYESRRARTPPPPVDFVADHPFMFMIKDSSTGVILFTGYVLNPLLNS